MCICLCIICVSNTLAQDKGNSEFNFHVAAGVQYDSKLSVPELDTVIDATDYAALIEAGGRYEWKTGDNEFSAGYDLFQRLQFDYSAFDLQIHNASARAARSFGQITASLSGNYVYSELDGEAYLTMARLTPALSGFLSRHLFARAALDVSDKEFEEVEAKDATVLSPSLRLYYFFNSFQTSIYGAYRFENEDASSSRYSFESHRFRLGLSHKFEVFDREARLRLETGYEDANYSGITPGVNAPRADENATFSAKLDIPIDKTFTVQVEYEYLDKSSNVDYLDYNQYTASVKISARF